MAFSRTPRTVRPKDPRDVASPHPLSDAALGSSLLLDVLVGARRAVARSTRHDVRALFPVRYRGGAKPAAPGAPHTRADRGAGPLPRDNQGETAASIRMRMRRGWTDGARA